MERKVSPYNEPLTPASPLLLCDVTLREGEQTAGVSFTQEERIGLVKRLEAARFQQVQLYNTWHGTAVDEKALEINAELCALPRTYCKTEVLNFNTQNLEALKKMIDLQAQTKPDIIHASFSLADGPEEELQEREHRIQLTADYIASKNIKCNISLLDSTRSKPELLTRLTRAAAHAGAARVRLADTVGVAEPDGIRIMCETAMQAIGDTPTLLGIHTHNDFGLGLADALAGIRGGARLIDGSLNALGERCGNASLIEIVLALEGLYGVSTGIDLTKLLDLAHYVEQISDIPLPANAPIVGKYAFSDSLGAHILLSAKKPFAVQGIRPETFGGHRLAFLSKNLTTDAIALLARRQGYTVTPQQCETIYRAICRETDGQKGVVLTEEDLPRFIKDTH